MPNVDDKALKFVWSVQLWHAQRSQCMEILNVNFIIFREREGIRNSTACEEKETYYLKKIQSADGGSEQSHFSNPHNPDYVHS